MSDEIEMDEVEKQFYVPRNRFGHKIHPLKEYCIYCGLSTKQIEEREPSLCRGRPDV